ncbi:RNA-binding protein [Streptococcus suis]|nr:RNA-binding protein [Streptococcus suis]
MVHEMLLTPKPFEMMKSGQKTIELRLYDEKRRHIRIGDSIRFYCTENQAQTMEAQVLDLHIFNNFTQLYKELDLLSCGYTKRNVREAKPEDMEVYYSREQLE